MWFFLSPCTRVPVLIHLQVSIGLLHWVRIHCPRFRTIAPSDCSPSRDDYCDHRRHCFHCCSRTAAAVAGDSFRNDAGAAAAINFVVRRHLGENGKKRKMCHMTIINHLETRKCWEFATEIKLNSFIVLFHLFCSFLRSHLAIWIAMGEK